MIKKNINKEIINQVKNLIENNQIFASVKFPDPQDKYGSIYLSANLFGSWKFREEHLQYEVWDSHINWEVCWINTSLNEIEFDEDLKLNWEEIKKFFPAQYKIIKEIKSLLDI